VAHKGLKDGCEYEKSEWANKSEHVQPEGVNSPNCSANNEGTKPGQQQITAQSKSAHPGIGIQK
jgi:hypothetical protein